MKLCVFPNDPLRAYYEKGEIKKNYFNPNNIFDEIHFISPTENEIEPQKIQEIVGDGKMIIHSIGNLNLYNYKKRVEKIKDIVKKINPDIIRSYNPLIQGWLAVRIAKQLKIPSIVSIHNNYDKDSRELFLKSRKYFSYLKFWYSSKTIEPFSIKNADRIICAYRFLVPYAKRFGAKKINVIYNRVNLSRFSPEIPPKLDLKKPTIINVARLSYEKNQECLIRAVKDLDVKLLLVGDGPYYPQLKDLVEELGIKEKIKFIKSVPNEDLASVYNSAEIFASPLKQGGVSITMLEAMACGLPVIATKRDLGESEDIDDAIIFSENNPESFKEAIVKLLENSKMKEQIRKVALEIVQSMNGDVMEKREADVYRELLRKN